MAGGSVLVGSDLVGKGDGSQQYGMRCSCPSSPETNPFLGDNHIASERVYVVEDPQVEVRTTRCAGERN